MKAETMANLRVGITEILALVGSLPVPIPLTQLEKIELTKVLLLEWLNRTGSQIFREER